MFFLLGKLKAQNMKTNMLWVKLKSPASASGMEHGSVGAVTHTPMDAFVAQQSKIFLEKLD